jgi:adenylate cyclase
MADLVVQGRHLEERWRRPLPLDQPVVLGRAAGDWAVPWDPLISHRHAELTWRDGRLKVQCLATARNPIFLRGEEAGCFELQPGEHFVIGATTFLLSEGQTTVSPGPQPLVHEVTVRAPDLKRIPFRDAPHRLDVLGRLPDVISGAANDEDLFLRLGNMLLAGISRAEAIALVAVEPGSAAGAAVQTLHWDRRRIAEGGFQPSQHLVLQAVRRQETVLHVWGAYEGSREQPTLVGNFDWAFCTPVGGEACAGWGIYVAGRFSGDAATTILAPWESNDLSDDLRFTELVAAILSSLRQVKRLQRKQASLSPFFSPAVLRTLTDGDPEVVLQPREAEVSVLFCDLRGFSRESEKGAADLLALLERVSRALGVMTQNILDNGGVIGDFHGDAAMGFWGWPLAQPDAVKRACLAALGIHNFFTVSSLRPDHPLAGFQAGIGIATGSAVAGRIGSTDQVKVTVFGPTVNLASRLEGMTKILRVPILLDEATARAVREQLPWDVARWRRLAVVKPYGLDTPLTVSELLPPASEYPLLTDEHLAHHEAAVEAIRQGQWSRANELLHCLPPQDQGKDFLLAFLIQHSYMPPPGWDGVIPLASKS